MAAPQMESGTEGSSPWTAVEDAGHPRVVTWEPSVPQAQPGCLGQGCPWAGRSQESLQGFLGFGMHTTQGAVAWPG